MARLHPRQSRIPRQGSARRRGDVAAGAAADGARAIILLVVLGHASPIGKLWESCLRSPLVFTWKAAVVAALLHSLPLLVKSARAALESVDRSCERAARTLGASEWRLFWRVTLPLAQRSILAATALAFARSLGDFGATLMVAGNIPGRTQTMAVAIYDAVEAGNSTLALTLVLVISAVALADSHAGQPSWSRDDQARASAKTFPPRPDSAGFSLDLEFQAAAGVTVLFGPSGAGKTLIARFDRRIRASG